MARKDAVYKLACEYAKANDSRQIAGLLITYKTKLKTGKADAILKFFMEGQLGSRTTQAALRLFVESDKRAISCKGYEEIKNAFLPGISTFQGTVFLKKNKEKYEDFNSQGLIIGLVINNPKMSDNIQIKTNNGYKISINKKDDKATLFLITDVKKSLSYNVSEWKRTSLDLLTSGTPLSRGSRVAVARRGQGNDEIRLVERKTPLQLFLETRTMNLMPSKRQLAKIEKQKKKVFGSELDEEGDVLRRPRAVGFLEQQQEIRMDVDY